MSDKRDPETDQVAPIPNDGPSCHDLVIEDMKDRKAFGLRKYDSLLQPHNGRSFLQDAYEEVLDLSVYLRGRIEEERSDSKEEPTKPGFYKYDGGSQDIMFRLSPGGQWWVWFIDNTEPEKCHWGYIEQALCVYNLVPL